MLANQEPRVVAEAKALGTSIAEQPRSLATTIRYTVPQGVHQAGTALMTARVNARHPGAIWQFDIHPKPLEVLASCSLPVTRGR